ncbi:MAG: riboflavin synthase [Gammaproteobacteria bacterium]|nr:riboflavin synthase [Gammaproteobacteria bacterium]
MFTGIIKGKGTLRGLERRGGDVRLSVTSPDLRWSDYQVGESISVNGVCLTAVAFSGDGFEADVSVETLKVTALGPLAAGASVNLEPALRVGERLGGHLVSGHVDCVGKITAMSSDARSLRVSIEIPPEYARYVAKKGSICVDGVSLTVNEVSSNTFEMNIIPHTTDVTTFGEYAVGTVVNIEVDQIARYLERLLEQNDDGVSLELLRAHGYA